GDVVQLVRTLPCHGRGREFESRRPRHSFQKSCTNFDETIEGAKACIFAPLLHPFRQSEPLHVSAYSLRCSHDSPTIKKLEGELTGVAVVLSIRLQLSGARHHSQNCSLENDRRVRCHIEGR